MAIPLDPNQLVSFEELLMSQVVQQEDPLLLHSIQEWEALWEITAKRPKDPGMGNPDWN